MKTWLIEHLFKEYAVEAFKKAHKDILETMQDDVEARAEALAKEKVEYLFSLVDEKSIVSQDKTGRIFLGGTLIENVRLQNLRSEAQYLKESDLWSILVETPKSLAYKALFRDDGRSEILHAKGRSMIYLLDTQQKIADLFASLSTPTNTG